MLLVLEVLVEEVVFALFELLLVRTVVLVVDFVLLFVDEVLVLTAFVSLFGAAFVVLCAAGAALLWLLLGADSAFGAGFGAGAA